MNVIDKITAKQIRTDLPEFRVGDQISVGLKIVEGNKERVQAFEGTVTAIQGSGIIRLREICREAVAIIFVQAVVGRNPDIAVLILTYIIDETTGKTFR